MRLADVAAVGIAFDESDALEAWRWLTGPDAEPLCVTEFGDVFVRDRQGRVSFFDTYAGTLAVAAVDEAQLEAVLEGPEARSEWLRIELGEELGRRGLRPSAGQCYSPMLPPAVGGTMAADNFECAAWRLHVGLAGQLHQRNRDYPDGTPISRFVSEE